MVHCTFYNALLQLLKRVATGLRSVDVVVRKKVVDSRDNT